jgi:excisionase family DNA binding protein
MKNGEGRRDNEKRLVSVTEAEAITGVSRWTWRRWAYDGRIVSTKLGTRLLIPVREIDRLVVEGIRPRVEPSTSPSDRREAQS